MHKMAYTPEYVQYYNKYIEHINNYIQNPELYKDSQIYAVLKAIQLKLITWDDIPPHFSELYLIPRICDDRVYLINLEYNKTAPIKLYEPDADITHNTYDSNNINRITLRSTINSMIQVLINNNTIHRPSFENIFSYNKKQIADDKYNMNITFNTIIEERPYLLESYNIITTIPKSRIKLELPCGTGKTYIIIYTILELLKIDSKLQFIILCPYIELSKQILKLCNHFRIITDYIGHNVKTYKQNSNVIICVYSSIQYIPKQKYKYIFIDDAHSIELIESLILEYLKGVTYEKQIHLSATYRHSENIDYKYNIRSAINDGYISDYIINVEYLTQGNKFNTLVQLIKDNLLWAPIFIYFNSSPRCIEFNQKLQENNIPSAYLIGTDTSTKRNQIKEYIVTNQIKVVSLCGIFNEGISVNSLQTVIFGDLIYSDINKIQLAMSACRLYKTKPYFRIVLPINNEDLQKQDLSDFIKLLANTDDTLKQAIINKSSTRIKIRINTDDILDYDLIYDQIYNKCIETEPTVLDIISDQTGLDIMSDEWIVILFEYCNKYNKIPSQLTIYKNQNIGIWLNKQKTKIINKTSEMYKKLSENQIMKDELDRFINNKGNKKLSVDEWIVILFEYCTEYNKIPSQITIYKNQNIGVWLKKQKQQIIDKTSEMYKKLSENQIMKDELNRFINNKGTDELTVDEWIVILFEYCTEYNKIPSQTTIYKNQNIGVWLKKQKQKIIDQTSEMYKKLSENQIMKDELNRFINNKETNKYSLDEWISILFQYCNEYNKIPSSNITYQNKNIGAWLNKQKTTIINKTSKMYKQLSENQIIKEELDRFIKKKDNNQLSFDRLKFLLFQYCNEYNKIPTQITTYKNKKIGVWLNIQKTKILDKRSEMYIILSVNRQIKEELDEFIKTKENNKISSQQTICQKIDNWVPNKKQKIS